MSHGVNPSVENADDSKRSRNTIQQRKKDKCPKKVWTIREARIGDSCLGWQSAI
jgi:hypothetical protein